MPWFCQDCLVHLTRAGTCDLVLDDELMSYLGSRTLPHDNHTHQRVLQAAKYISMTEDGKVWVDDPRTGTQREVPPLHG